MGEGGGDQCEEGCTARPEEGTQVSAIGNCGVETEQALPVIVSVPLDVLA